MKPTTHLTIFNKDQIHPALKELQSIETEEKKHALEANVSDEFDYNIKMLLENIISRSEHTCFHELAEKHLKTELLTAKGESRAPTAKEACVIIAEHFKSTCDILQAGVAKINGLIHFYTGKHWHPLDQEDLESYLGKFAEAIGNGVADSRYVDNRKKFAEQLRAVADSKDQPKQTMVNFLNGTLRITEDDEYLSDHEKENAFTYVLPFEYIPNAKCPLFTRYLERVLPDQESRIVLAEFFGYIFLRDLKLEKMLVLLGHGHNGKSVLFDIVTALLGDSNISNIGYEYLKKPESRYPLLGKLLNFGSEIGGNVPLDIFKKASSGEPLEFRKLYGDLITSKNYARLAFNANDMPTLTEQTTGFFRRFLIIPFEETISSSEKDPDLADKIIAGELPGVMNWIFEGMRRVRKNRKFSQCHKSDQCLERYKLDSDSVAQFLQEEGYVASAEERISKAEFYTFYKNFCIDDGYKCCSNREFSKRLQKQHNINETRLSHGRYWNVERIDVRNNG